MDISVTNAFRNLPTGLEGLSSVHDVKPEMTKSALTVSERPSVASDAVEASDAVPDECLRRDDDLGTLFSRAFGLQAPPMPDFAKMGGGA